MEYRFSIIAITESCLKNVDTVIPAGLKSLGYSFIQKCRSDGRNGGGIALLVKNHITIIPQPEICTSNCDFLFTKLKIKNNIIPILLVYRPPNNCHTTFALEFTNFIHEHNYDNLVILGDFNFHYDSYKLHHQDFKRLCNELNLTQHVNFATHTHGHILDLILTYNHSNILIHKPTRSTLLTDHYAINSQLNILNSSPRQTLLTYRCIRKINIDEFSSDFISMINKTQITVLNLNTILKQLLNQHAPLKTNYLTIHNETPWFNSKLNNLKVLFRKSCRLFTKSPSHSNLIDLRKNRYIYRNELKSTKTDYFTNKINDCSHDYKRLYSITKTLLGNNKNSTLPHFPDDQLCKKFAEYFKDKINTICNRLSCTFDPLYNAPQILPCTSTLTHFTVPTNTAIYNYIVTARCSSPHDPIPLYLIKKLASTLTFTYKNIIDDSLLTGTIPNLLKNAIITPIIKKTNLDSSEFSNYRPISQLPLLTKILEKTVYTQLSHYLTENMLLDIRQNAFRKLHSTETTVLSLFDDLYNSLDTGQPIQLILLDLSSAFDTLRHDILLERLRNIGIQDVTMEWFSNFIKDRNYSIKIRNNYSKSYTIDHGVPQGSILSPILFSIYLIPLQTIMKRYPSITYNLYADDIELHATITNSTQLQDCLNELQNWLTNNNLLLNHNKTELLNITNDPNTYFPDIIINQHKIIPTNSVKYLGVNFNNKLNLDKHYSLLTQSTTAQLFNIKKIRPYLNRNTTKLLTQTLILSRLQYCNSLFTGTEKLKIDKIDKIINRSIRNIYRLQKTDYTTSITDLRKKLNWLNTEDSINYKILTILKKTITYNLPYNLRNKIKHKPNTRLLRNNNSTILHQPITHCIKYERRKFSSSSTIRWNKLPPQLRNQNISINIFKKKLKKCLIDKH